MTRLSTSVLSQLEGVKRPSYDRSQLKPRIVHLGIGAFHRAHQAYYTEELLNLEGGDWGIVGCSLRSPTVKEQLEPQDGLYTLFVKGEQSSAQVIGAVQRVLVGPEDPSAVVDAIANESVKIVSLTVTEKGYCHNPATGELNFDHPDIVHDLFNLDKPKTAVGFIVAGLKKRHETGLPPISILSCDNLPDNGQVVKRVVCDFAERVSISLASWVKNEVNFPGTMIDRIVPATTENDIHELAQNAGYEDKAMVCAEPFSQWVIEDNFSNDRPAWEKVGATFVKDVAAYETMKLRLLNGSHSLLAYVGYLSGYETIYNCMQDDELVELTQAFMHTASKSLKMPEGFSVLDYQQQLIDRFSNPGLLHRTWQIAMDGSQKVPQRWLNTMRDLLAADESVDIFCLALAAWMRYCLGRDEDGGPIELSDPLAEQLKDIAVDNRGQWRSYVDGFFAVSDVFEGDFASQQALVDKCAQYLEQVYSEGMQNTFAEFVASSKR